MSNDRVKVVQVKGGMGSISYNTFLDGKFIGNYRLKKEALEAGQKRIDRLKEEEEQLRELVNDTAEEYEHGGEG